MITHQLRNLSNLPTKLITYLLLPLLGYWSGGMRGAVGIIIIIIIIVIVAVVIITIITMTIIRIIIALIRRRRLIRRI